MEDRQILALSLTISTIGLLLLALGVSLRQPVTTVTENVTQDMQGELIQLEGTASDVKFNGEHLFFTLADDTGDIRTVLFESNVDDQSFYPAEMQNGDTIRVTGRVDIYKGELEVVAERVTLL